MVEPRCEPRVNPLRDQDGGSRHLVRQRLSSPQQSTGLSTVKTSRFPCFTPRMSLEPPLGRAWSAVDLLWICRRTECEERVPTRASRWEHWPSAGLESSLTVPVSSRVGNLRDWERGGTPVTERERGLG